MEATPKILIVDDDVLIVSLIKKTLEGTGYTILEASDGEDGLRIALEEERDE